MDRLTGRFGEAGRPNSDPIQAIVASAPFPTCRRQAILRVTRTDLDVDGARVHGTKNPGETVGNDVWRAPLRSRAIGPGKACGAIVMRRGSAGDGRVVRCRMLSCRRYGPHPDRPFGGFGMERARNLGIASHIFTLTRIVNNIDPEPKTRLSCRRIGIGAYMIPAAAACVVAAALARAWPTVAPLAVRYADKLSLAGRAVSTGGQEAAKRTAEAVVKLTATVIRGNANVYHAFAKLEANGSLAWEKVGEKYILRFLPNEEGLAQNFKAAELVVTRELSIDNVTLFLRAIGIRLGGKTDSLWSKLFGMPMTVGKQADKLHGR